MLLAIDTSNDYAGVALWDERGLRGEATWFAGRQHTEQVLPQIDLLLRHVGASTSALTVVAVAMGPGSWSGLRAGMSLAKALVVSRGLPLVGVASLDALAYAQRQLGIPVLASMRLGRDRFGIAIYEPAIDTWGRRSDFQAVDGAELRRQAQGKRLVGDLPDGFAPPGDGAEGWRVAPTTDLQRRAPFVAELAWLRHGRGEHDDVVALEPIYLGNPVRE
jgi:tRNA threonylcarbamoyladenosine biosynthesis protein TsaB